MVEIEDFAGKPKEFYQFREIPTNSGDTILNYFCNILRGFCMGKKIFLCPAARSCLYLD